MDLKNVIESVIDEKLIDGVSGKVGIPKNKAQDVVSLAIPLIIGGLAKNAKNPQEAENIVKALQKDHSGDIQAKSSSTFLDASKTEEGGKILGHVLGDKVGLAYKSIGSKTQVDTTQVQQILTTLAPIIMGSIGSQQKNQELNSATLVNLLQNGLQSFNMDSSQRGNLISQILDQNKNGSVVDDLIGFGTKYLKKLLKLG